jgi:hypothetical protein
MKMPDVPAVTLTLAANKSFQAVNPTIPLKDKEVYFLSWEKNWVLESKSISLE